MILVDNLCYEYPGKRALDQVSFRIEAGTITALVGPNGAGKTTLLRCLAALDRPFSGSVKIFGVETTAQPRAIHRQLGYLSDSFGLYSDLTVQQCLQFGARSQTLEGEAARTALAYVVKLLGLQPWLNSKAGTLSRGWRQRLGMALAMLHRPKLLLLDEPASGLDPEARVGLSALFRHLQAEGTTLIVSSHILSELEDYCTHMIVLRDGQMIKHQQAAANDAAEHDLCYLTFLDEAAKAIPLLQNDPLVRIQKSDGNRIDFSHGGSPLQRARLVQNLLGQGCIVTGFGQQQQSLQDIYLAANTPKAGA